MLRSSLLSLLVLSAPLAARAAEPEPGARGGAGLAIRCAKALVCAEDWEEPQVVNRATVLVRDGLIEAVGRSAELEVPAGYELVDVGERWVMPGMIDLHNHIAGSGGLNDTVFQANPGLRIAGSVQPLNPSLRRSMAAGVTTVLFIPGSGSNVGGVGVLVKTGLPLYEEAELRQPGSLKVAQGDNPTRWGYGMGRVMMNWVIRNTFQRGVEYAAAWTAFEEGTGARPDVDPQFEIFRALVAGQAQISTHTQVPQLVYATIRIAWEEFGLPVYLDHSTVGGYVYGELAESYGIAAICGPRSIDSTARRSLSWMNRTPNVEGIRGVAAGYQAAGHTRIGFNTDAPVIPGEDLFLQAAVGVRYGLDDSRLESVRGLTIVPALAAGIEDRVGSLEVGKHADLLVIQGHPADPRNAVDQVFIEGRRVYDADSAERVY